MSYPLQAIQGFGGSPFQAQIPMFQMGFANGLAMANSLFQPGQGFSNFGQPGEGFQGSPDLEDELGEQPGVNPFQQQMQNWMQEMQAMQQRFGEELGGGRSPMTGIPPGANNFSPSRQQGYSPVNNVQPTSMAPSQPARTATQAPAASAPQTTPTGASGSVQQNAQIVAQVARQKGVDPVTAVATMLQESGGNSNAIGDGGTSFGLFQLHKGGELGNMSEQQAFDPTTNAQTALSQFAANQGKYSDPGQLAAASQRPANPTQYARSVDALLPQARQLLGMS